jgi:hypothetical protein
MPRATTRYMCLGCGRFWHMPHLEIKPAQHVCPYCRDMYWIDNIDPRVPESLKPMFSSTCPSCGVLQIVETAGDMNWCCACGQKLNPPDNAPRLEDLQMKWAYELMKGGQP